MNILFIQPIVATQGTECISAYLKFKGHQVSCLYDPYLFHDALFNIPSLSEKLDYTEILLGEIEKEKPGLICFSVVYDLFQWALSRAKSIKSRFHIPIVMGGIHPTSVPEKVLENPEIDFVIVGEGEEASHELAFAMEKGYGFEKIKNLGYKAKGRIVKNPLRHLIQNLDSLPHPDKELLFPVWSRQLRGGYSTIASRGCPHNCTYCFHSVTREMYRGLGKYTRHQSVDYFLDELDIAREKFNAKHFFFHNESITINLKWFREFAVKYKERIGMPYFCWTSPDSLDKERCDLLEKSGCAAINIGIQNAPDKELDEITDRVKQSRYLDRALTLLDKTRIFVSADNIIGIPGQTEKHIMDHINFYRRYKVDHIGLYWLRYFPKAKIIESAFKEGILTKKDIDDLENGRPANLLTEAPQAANPNIIRLANILALVNVIPDPITKWILGKKSRLAFVPKTSFYYIGMVIVSVRSTFIRKKKKLFVLYTPLGLIAHYYHFIKKRITFTA